MNKKYLIGGLVLGLGTFTVLFVKRPKGKIIINPDGSGTAQLGSKTSNFSKDMGVVLKTWNGWELSASSTNMVLRHFGKAVEKGDIAPCYGGSSNVEIIHNDSSCTKQT